MDGNKIISSLFEQRTEDKRAEGGQKKKIKHFTVFNIFWSHDLKKNMYIYIKIKIKSASVNRDT